MLNKPERLFAVWMLHTVLRAVPYALYILVIINLIYIVCEIF